MLRLPTHHPFSTQGPDLELGAEEFAVVPREQLDPASSLLANLETLAPPEAAQGDLTHAMLFYALTIGPANGRLVFVRRANPERIWGASTSPCSGTSSQGLPARCCPSTLI
jgi:hypothetical protein